MFVLRSVHVIRLINALDQGFFFLKKNLLQHLFSPNRI